MSKNAKIAIVSVLIIAVLAFAVVKFCDSTVKGVDFTSALGRDNVKIASSDTPDTDDEYGVVHDEDWAELYPDVYASYMANEDNSYTVEYLDEDPGLKEIYEGFGFAKSYLEARGHNYTIEDVSNTARPHALANCLTCKTSTFTSMVNKLGAEVYSYEFDEVASQCIDSVGCYNCHGNEVGNEGELVVTHDYINNTLTDKDSIDEDTLACGQCHIEYYFRTEDKGTEIPYTNTEEMSPTAILEFYDSIDFADYTQESTGAKMLKAQHPEMETVTGEGNKHTALGITCADCHMAVQEGESGELYVSHKLVSPVDDSAEAESIRANVCAECHGDENMQAKVADIQSNVTAREKEVLASLVQLKADLTEAVSSKKYTESELDDIRYAYRAGEWFFDFCYVENSEGAHNSRLANECLAKAEAYVAQANKLLGK